jgi:O-antigen/teichoic acid export membrane protein
VAPLLRRSWPLVGHALLGLVIFNSGLFFLRAFRDTATVGQYAVAYTLVSFCTNLGVMYGFSLLPALTRLRDDPAAERALYDESQARAFAVALPVAAGTTLLAGGIMWLAFGGGYVAGSLALQILIWSVPVALFRNVAVGLLIARDRQHDVLLTTVWAAAVNVALNLALIPPFGMAGAAAATVATELVRTVAALRYAGRARLPLTPAARFWRAGVAAAVMAAVLLAIRPPLWAAVPLGAAVYGAVLAALGGVRFAGGGLPRLSV